MDELEQQVTSDTDCFISFNFQMALIQSETPRHHFQWPWILCGARNDTLFLICAFVHAVIYLKDLL